MRISLTRFQCKISERRYFQTDSLVLRESSNDNDDQVAKFTMSKTYFLRTKCCHNETLENSSGATNKVMDNI